MHCDDMAQKEILLADIEKELQEMTEEEKQEVLDFLRTRKAQKLA